GMQDRLRPALSLRGLFTQPSVGVGYESAPRRTIWHRQILPPRGEVEQQKYATRCYAETLLGNIRRSGFARGVGNCMCQKFISGELNSTPTYCLPSRAR